MNEKKISYSKALKYEKKGDKLLGKGKVRPALEAYQISETHYPEREEIYNKLIETLNSIEDEWSEEDFSLSMHWTMRLQEVQNPKIKRVHEQFSLEFQRVQKLVQQLLVTNDEASEEALIDQILSYGERATLPLLHFITSLKDMVFAQMNENAANEEQELTIQDFKQGFDNNLEQKTENAENVENKNDQATTEEAKGN